VEDRRFPPSSSGASLPSDSPDASSYVHSALMYVVGEHFKCEHDMGDKPPYNPAVTSARAAERVSRAITFLPITAWIGTSKSCRGITVSMEPDGEIRQKHLEASAGRLTQFLDPGATNDLLRGFVNDEGQRIHLPSIQKENHLFTVISSHPCNRRRMCSKKTLDKLLV
jgi:hypothetical protein